MPERPPVTNTLDYRLPENRWFEWSREPGRVTWMEPFLDEETQKPATRVSIPIYHHGVFAGTASTRIDLARLGNLAKTTHYKSLRYFLSSRNGTFIYHYDSLKILHANILNDSSILDNAISFSPEGGQVVLHTEATGSGVPCTFFDRGKGFSEEDLKNFNKLFANADHHTDQKLGLDLALASMIMEAHGGTLEVGNNTDGGAFVSLTFRQ